MTGIFHGLGQSVTTALFLLFFVPMITVLLLRTLPFFDRLRRAEPLLILSTAYLLVGTITWLLLRNLRYTAMRYLVWYAMIASILLVLLTIRTIIRKRTNKSQQPPDTKNQSNDSI